MARQQREGFRLSLYLEYASLTMKRILGTLFTVAVFSMALPAFAATFTGRATSSMASSVRPTSAASETRKATGTATTVRASVTCTKSFTGKCVTFTCSDKTTYNPCLMCSAAAGGSKSSSALARSSVPKDIAKKIQAAPKALFAVASSSSSSTQPKFSYDCDPEFEEGGCFFRYCGSGEKKTDLLRVACPSLSYGASFYNGTTCTFTIIEYAKKAWDDPGTCRSVCDKDEFPGMPIGSKKNVSETGDCPLWMHAPEAPVKPGANDQYCKEHPEDSFICNPSAG